MKIVYYYLNKLFNCSFEYACFEEFVFNSTLIQLLFGNAKIPKQLYIQKCDIIINDYNIENIFKFILNNLVGKILKISLLLTKDIMEENKNILFKILTNRGNNLKKFI
uniref:Uncharacterized protein n=1 Tax=Meloidogyne enterolobii TaxID=390850 RepID=A0A6V7TXK2_MELEN|nr:unnamed protein product [Meloidogyne enterolobii]